MSVETFSQGDVVVFGPPGAHRVGVVIGAYDDPVNGETLCVRTPQNVIKEQKFDPCPLKLMEVRQASEDELREATEAAIQEAHVRATEYFKAVHLHLMGLYRPEQLRR